MTRRPLTPEQLASVREDVERGERELLAFIRGEGPMPGLQTLHTMPKDRDYSSRSRSAGRDRPVPA